MARSEEFWDERSPPCVNNFVLLSPQWTKRMATIHDEIDTWLAADLHGELSNNERSALHTHLVDCAACRKTHHETKTMNKILEETFAQEKPDQTLDQRMLAGFLDRSGGISAGRPQDLALQPPAPPAAARSKFQGEGKVSATTAEPAKA